MTSLFFLFAGFARALLLPLSSQLFEAVVIDGFYGDMMAGCDFLVGERPIDVGREFPASGDWARRMEIAVV